MTAPRDQAFVARTRRPQTGGVYSVGLDFRRPSPETAKQLCGLSQPPASCLNLVGVSAVLEVAVPFAFRGATAVCATVHPAPSPPRDRRRLAWRARPCLGSTTNSLCQSSGFSGTHGVTFKLNRR